MILEHSFDGLPGPTHHYGGLSTGNMASQKNKTRKSSPKLSALQGLNKMSLVMSLGFPQGVLPPQERPHIPWLKSLGFTGTNESNLLQKVIQEAPTLLSMASSSSFMWAANTATVRPSSSGKTHPGKVVFLPAQLVSETHRSIECEGTSMALKALFPEGPHFTHCPPLPSTPGLGDEGAANHTHFSPDGIQGGIHLFVYGTQHAGVKPMHHSARQTREACEAIARFFGLSDDEVVFAQQSLEAIDAGAFHNDVISVGHTNTFLFHEKSFLSQEKVLDELQKKYQKRFGSELQLIEVKNQEVSLQDAIESYLFNSQLLTEDGESFLLLAPARCEHTPSVKAWIENHTSHSHSPIRHANYIDLQESMRNGGGPPCLRLRVPMHEI